MSTINQSNNISRSLFLLLCSMRKKKKFQLLANAKPMYMPITAMLCGVSHSGWLYLFQFLVSNFFFLLVLLFSLLLNFFFLSLSVDIFGMPNFFALILIIFLSRCFCFWWHFQALDDYEIEEDLPNAMKLLGEMNNNVKQVSDLVESMLQRVKSGELTTEYGLSFLEVRYHMLLTYLINLTYVVLRKCAGNFLIFQNRF